MHAAGIIFINLGLIATLPITALGQTNTLTNQSVFPLKFRATCRSLNTNATRVVNSELTEQDIIANALGSNAPVVRGFGTNRTNPFPGFAVVYNPTLDNIQVINTNAGTLVANVIDFSELSSVGDNRVQTRVAFVFLAGQNNAIGSAVLNSVRPVALAARTNTNAVFIGNLQFALTGNDVLGGNNSTPTNALAGISSPAGPFSGLMPGSTAAPIPGFGVTTGFLANTNVVNNTNLVVSTNLVGAGNPSFTNNSPQTNVRVCMGFFFAAGPALNVSLLATPTGAPGTVGLPPGANNSAPVAPVAPVPTFPGTLPPPSPTLPANSSSIPTLPVPGMSNAPPGI